MAVEGKARSANTAARRKERGEEEIRLHCMAGTRQALAELMQWAGIEEQGEAITLMIHHLQGLGPTGSARFLEAPKHEITISPKFSAMLSNFRPRQISELSNDQPRAYLNRAMTHLIGSES